MTESELQPLKLKYENITYIYPQNNHGEDNVETLLDIHHAEHGPPDPFRMCSIQMLLSLNQLASWHFPSWEC